MTNKEILNYFSKVDEKDNFLDKIEMLYTIQDDYKKSDFYKKIKLPIIDLYEKYSMDRNLNLQGLFASVQKEINKLDLSHLMDLINQVGDVFGEENKQVLSNFNVLKEIMGNTKQ